MKLNCWTHIDEMPIYNWYKVNTGGDVSFMLVRPRPLKNKEEKSELEKRFNVLFQQFIDVFGFNEEYIEKLERRRDIALLMCEKYITGDRSLTTIIKAKQAEINSEEKQSAPVSFQEITIHVSKYLGYHVDVRKMSVSEFQTAVNTLKKNG